MKYTFSAAIFKMDKRENTTHSKRVSFFLLLFWRVIKKSGYKTLFLNFMRFANVARILATYAQIYHTIKI